MWLFTAVVVLALGPPWGRSAHAAECGAWIHGRVLQDGDARAGAGVSGRGRRPKTARDKEGWTPLHWAALTETPAVITTLVAAGAALMARDENGLTPLHLAAGFTKTPAVITTLVAAGATLTARDKEGWTPLHWAARSTETPAVITALLQPRGLRLLLDRWEHRA